MKITVGQYEAEEPVMKGGEAERSYDPSLYDEEAYNKYMLSTSGPKKVIDYSQVADTDEWESLDQDMPKADDAAVSGQYRMKHQNEKFSLGGVKSKPQEEESR